MQEGRKAPLQAATKNLITVMMAEGNPACLNCKRRIAMARTLLAYSVLTQDKWSEKKNAVVRKITHRGFDFSVAGVSSKAEEAAYLESFVDYLFERTGIDARGNFFGCGGFRCFVDRASGEKVESDFVSIGIETMEQKAEVEECYRRWKAEVRPFVTQAILANASMG